MGLRELKKAQNRQAIADAAWRLFADRGFDRVTVAEVARAAQVAEATVFNHFATKEDLFYSRLEAFGAGLIEAVGGRRSGESVLVAFRRQVLSQGGLLAAVAEGDTHALAQLRTVNRLIAASPALRAREQQILAGYTDALASLLAAESGRADRVADDITARVAAIALMGVHRTLIEFVRRRVLADEEPVRLGADVQRLGRRAFALLERGLHDYATRPARPGRGGAS